MKLKVRSKQKTTISFKARLVIGASCFLLIAGGIFISLNVNNVHETYAASPGDYRSASTGNWEDASIWETFEGKEWEPAAAAPVNTDRRIFITAVTAIKVNREVTVSEIIIEKDGFLQLNAPLFHIKKQGAAGAMTVNGVLDAGKAIIDGYGDFTLKDNSEIVIGSPDGISKSNSGNIQVTGKRYYSSFAHYTYNGSEPQQTGKGIPFSVSALEIDNPAGVDMQGNLFVTSLLHLKKGTLNTRADTLILGTGKTSDVIVKREGGGVSGNLKRWLNKSSMKDALFPLMESSNYNGIYMTVKQGDYPGGTFTFSFVPETIKKNRQPENGNTRIITIGESGYYKVTAGDGFENGTYKLVTSIAVSKNVNNSYWTMSAKSIDAELNKSSIGAAAAELVNNISIMPNPFKEKFTLKFNLTEPSEVEINLLSANGQVVFKDKINGQEAENTYEYFDQKNLPTGNYILRIITGDKVETRKLVKQ